MIGPETLNFPAPAHGSWATTNLAEALPGVASPLGWSFWARAADRGARAPFVAMGAIPPAAAAYPRDPVDRVVSLFYGRIAIRVDYFCAMGDLVPGASGEAVARDAFGYVPPDFVSHPSYRRLPVFAVKMPVAALCTPARVRRVLAESERRYPTDVARVPRLALDQARRVFADAERDFVSIMSLQAVAIACAIQPVFTALSTLAREAGVDPAPLMRAQGDHVEAGAVEMMWRLSRGEVGMEEFLARFGFHGPDEGELSSRSWREDPAAVERMVRRYRSRPDSESPFASAAIGAARREQAEAEFLARLGGSRRPVGRLVLRAARARLPLRSVAKVAYARTLDIARAAARRSGALLTADGILDDPDDVFYLTTTELVAQLPADVRAVVAERRAQREEYRGLELPANWTGPPVPRPLAEDPLPSDRVDGVGVSSGVVVGRAVVVDDPTTVDFEVGDVLVARTTDPGWASVMFLAGAMVVDIGGMLSHAAVVARELGIPCVMGTGSGTRVLRSGDVCRVDGHAGTVEIVSRASGR